MNGGRYSFPRVIELFGSNDSYIEVPFGHVPVKGYFDGKIFVVNHNETSLTKTELVYALENEEFISEPFEPPSEDDTDFRWNDCIVMVPINRLKEIGIEVNTSEGWGWDDESLQSYFIEKPDETHKWNPYVKKWEKVCETCSELRHHTLEYDLLNYMTEDYLFGAGAEVSFCECDRCPRCKRLQYIDDGHFHDACERRE
jgi:hypothetical protein